MAGIVVAKAGGAERLGIAVELQSLGSAHIGTIASKPDESGLGGIGWQAQMIGDAARFGAVSDGDAVGFEVRHRQILTLIADFSPSQGKFVENRFADATTGGDFFAMPC